MTHQLLEGRQLRGLACIPLRDVRAARATNARRVADDRMAENDLIIGYAILSFEIQVQCSDLLPIVLDLGDLPDNVPIAIVATAPEIRDRW